MKFKAWNQGKFKLKSKGKWRVCRFFCRSRIILLDKFGFIFYTTKKCPINGLLFKLCFVRNLVLQRGR